MFLSTLLLCAAPTLVPQDPVAHALSVKLEPEIHRLSVTDRVTLPAPLAVAGAELTLNERLEITESTPALRRLGAEEGRARYALEAAPEGGVLSLTYAGTFDFGLSDQKEEYTRGFRETLGTVGPEGVFLDGGSGWFPRFGDEMITFTLEVEGPEDWHVISQGNGSSDVEPGLAQWDSAGLLEQVYLVGGPLVVERDVAGAIETLVYLHEPDEALSRKYLDATARYLEMYRGLIGTYPYGKFALVENFWETGYGMPSFTLLGPQVIRFPFILTSSYPHEILHNWWGNSVFVDYGSGNWCEGLTAYLADHLIQEQRGKGSEYRRNTLQKYRNYVRDERDFPLSEFHSRHSAATEAVGYGKSLMLFHMLRRRIGEDDFRRVLATFYRKFRGQRASFNDFRGVAESVSGEELGGFFAQWVGRTGAPALMLDETFDVTDRPGSPDARTLTGMIRQTQKTDLFELQVPIVVHTTAGAQEFRVDVTDRETRFQLPLDGYPMTLAVDPLFDVFRNLDPRETPPSIGQIFGDDKVLAVLPASSGDEGIKRYRELVGAWQSDAHEVTFALDYELEELPADRAVWVLGVQNRFAAPLIRMTPGLDVSASGSTVQLADDRINPEDHSIVAVSRHPRNLEKAVGWLVLDPPEALPGMIRKLPHYGKYSYLAFEGDEPTNVIKGQWPVSDSPLLKVLGTGIEVAPVVDDRTALAELPPVFSSSALSKHVEWLAAPEREGRVPGSAGLVTARDYIAEAFATAGLEPGGDEGGWFQSFTLEAGPDGKPVEVANVVGVLRGKRSDWAEQSIVLGAHYDHLGLGWPDAHAGDEGKLHAGADDNASGVAVLIELAKNLASEGGGQRNLVFVAFTAEECGLRGSRYYVEHPRFSLDGLRGVINLDTVGRLFDQPLLIHGCGTADEWQHVFRGCGFVTGIENKIVMEGAEGSDQWSFIEKGIPGVQVFTGAHLDYHSPRDTVEKVDVAGLVKVATFVKEAVVYMTERPEVLTVTIAGTVSAPKDPAAAGGRRVSFGSMPDFAYQGKGYKLGTVTPDSPADKAGLVAGDVLIRIAGQEVTDIRGFSEILKTLQPGQTVKATVQRGEEEITADVTVVER